MSKKDELQMLLLEKIQSHNVPKPDHTDMLFAGLSESFKKLDTIRQLRDLRHFAEILETEYTDQENQRQYDSD